MDNTPTNPLNTGNGSVPTAPVTPVQNKPTTPAPTVPTPITPKPAAAPVQPTNQPAPSATNMEKLLSMKKYIIAGVAIVALLVTVYYAYSYFTGISSAVTQVQNDAATLNNKLGAPSSTDTTTDKTKLNNVVNQLKDQYQTPTTPPTPATDTNSSTPPGMIINLSPDSSPSTTTDTTTSTNTSGGIKR